MENKLTEMLRKKRADNPKKIDMAVKEVMQELILASLSTTDFFSIAGFYGGTALRIFHGLNRFSEDLDFALLKENRDFRWTPYLKTIQDQFSKFGLRVEALEREKIAATDTRSAFIKENAIETMRILLPSEIAMPPLNHNQVVKIKFGVDTVPPEGATFQWFQRGEPFVYVTRVLDLPSLFAGKLSAVLLRHWDRRVKGRDFYDYLFYVGHDVKVNLDYLSANLRKGGAIEEPLTLPLLKKMLAERFQSVDFKEAAAEVSDFLQNPHETEWWDAKFFLDSLDRIQAR